MIFKDWAWTSDLHLSDKTAGDDFAPREEICNQSLDYLLREGIRRLYLGGDIFDCWEVSGKTIQKKYKDFLDRLFRSFSVNVIAGNHDQLDRSISVLVPYLSNYGNRALFLHESIVSLPLPEDIQGSPISALYPVMLLHGHQVDHVISENPKLAGVVAQVGAWFERHGFPNVDRQFSKLEQRIAKIGKHTLPKFDNAICDLAIKGSCGSVFAGHSHNHKSMVKDLGNGKELFYFNAGSWTSSEKGKEPRIIIVRREGVQELIAGNKLEISEVKL